MVNCRLVTSGWTRPIASAFAAAVVLGMTTLAFAADGSAAADNEFSVKVAIALACGFGIGLAAFGGALGQAKAASAALDGIARNPGAQDKIFTPMILGLALIESLVIYSLVISFMLLGKL